MPTEQLQHGQGVSLLLTWAEAANYTPDFYLRCGKVREYLRAFEAGKPTLETLPDFIICVVQPALRSLVQSGNSSQAAALIDRVGLLDAAPTGSLLFDLPEGREALDELRSAPASYAEEPQTNHGP